MKAALTALAALIALGLAADVLDGVRRNGIDGGLVLAGLFIVGLCLFAVWRLDRQRAD